MLAILVMWDRVIRCGSSILPPGFTWIMSYTRTQIRTIYVTGCFFKYECQICFVATRFSMRDKRLELAWLGWKPTRLEPDQNQISMDGSHSGIYDFLEPIGFLQRILIRLSGSNLFCLMLCTVFLYGISVSQVFILAVCSLYCDILCRNLHSRLTLSLCLVIIYLQRISSF